MEKVEEQTETVAEATKRASDVDCTDDGNGIGDKLGVESRRRQDSDIAAKDKTVHVSSSQTTPSPHIQTDQLI